MGDSDKMEKKSSFLPRTMLEYLKFLERLFYAIGFLWFFITGVSNMVSHTKFRTNSSYHTLTCKVRDKCSDSQGSLLLDEHDTDYEINQGIYIASFAIIIIFGGVRMVLNKLKVENTGLDLFLRMVEFSSLVVNFGWLSSLLLRSVHFQEWNENKDGHHLNYLQSVVSNRESGHNSVIEGYHVENHTTFMGDHKNSYNFFITALIFFILSQAMSTLGCYKKEIHAKRIISSAYRNFKDYKNKPEKKDLPLWKLGLNYIFDRAAPIVTFAFKIAILVLATKVYFDLKNFKTTDFEVLVKRSTHNEFDTDSNYFTAYVKDVFPKANHTNYTAWNVTELVVRNHSTDVSSVETDIYLKSNVCQTTEDSIVTITNMRYTYGFVSMLQIAAISVILIIDVLIMCFRRLNYDKPNELSGSQSSLKMAVKVLNFIANMHTLVILIVSVVFYWKFIHNSQSTQCQRSGLMNSNKVDHIYKEIYWITVLCLGVLYNQVQEMDTDTNTNHGNKTVQTVFSKQEPNEK